MNLELDMSGLVEKLGSCSTSVVTKGKRKALRAGGKVIERAMYLRAPLLDKKTASSTALDPGSLRDGMRTYVHEDNGDLEALVGPKAAVEHVARFVEYGHRLVHGGYSKVTGGGKTRGPGRAGDVDVPAHPFLRPAYEESFEGVIQAEKASLAQTIEEQVR